ncbi:MAG TPA: hypothetical protein VLT83_04045 [Opitutaceae bacterium]|nr:hypothetical protein [Opitutaceae bacterium]
MESTTHTISVKGQPVAVPSVAIGGARVIASGRFVRVAVVHDEEWLEPATLPDPAALLATLKRDRFRADIFSFTQRIPDTKPRYSYRMEWDNAAVIPITTYQAWWEKLPQVARRNVRIAAKKGVAVRVVPFDDELIHGIAAVYNEAPIRLGKRFWHYGKDFETVKRENGTYLERSEFIGAFYEGKLIGFIKLVYVDRIGSMMQILSMVQHQDKRTTNALIAKAVEVCEAKGMSYLKYCQYVYDSNESSLLTDFKRRNGFERLDFPRYYVPLTRWGRVALALRAHRGIKGWLPRPVLQAALQLRAKYYNLRQPRGVVAAE